MSEKMEAEVRNMGTTEKGDKKRSFYEKSLFSILDTINDFPENSKICQEKTRNNKLECAVDLVTVVQAHLQIVNNLEKRSDSIKHYGYEKLQEYEKEMRCLGQEIRGILDNNYQAFLADLSQEEVAQKKKEDVEFILERIDKKTEEIKKFIERMILLPRA